jgi:hypothetical protein
MTYIYKAFQFSLAATYCSPAIKGRGGNTGGVSLEVTREMVRHVQHIVQKLGDIKHLYTINK